MSVCCLMFFVVVFFCFVFFVFLFFFCFFFHFRRLQNNCMKNFDSSFDYETFLQTPTVGERYTVEEQCQNVFGRSSSKCVSLCAVSYLMLKCLCSFLLFDALCRMWNSIQYRFLTGHCLPIYFSII